MRKGLKFHRWIEVPKAGLGTNAPVEIQGVRALSSFNKIADNEIAVPGVPPRLRPLTNQLTLLPDHNNKSLERNYPTFTYPFEPLIRSIQAVNPDFDWTQTDIVTNASNLRKMFILFSNQQMENERFDLTWKNGVLFLSKWTKDPHLNSSVGHGSGFEKATCIHEDDEDELLKSSASHHRVIEYRFGGLRLVVQSEVDAYHCDCHCPGATTSDVDHTLPETMSAMTIHDVQPGDHDDGANKQRRSSSGADSGISWSPRSSNFSLASTVFTDTSLASGTQPNMKLTKATTTLSSSSPPPSPFSRPSTADKPPSPNNPSSTTSLPPFSPDIISSPTLHILPLGRPIPHPCLVEVKTHKVRNKPLFNAEAQLFFCQVSKLFVAKNNAGVFDVKHQGPLRDMTEEIKNWVEDRGNQRTLRKVVMFLRELREIARDHADGRGRGLTVLMKSDGTGEEGGLRFLFM
ncbi:hypothetical protein B0T20DRAFT_348045 [Sordaria brevicollis]|uniref:Uncharacterized protein n=1 Tax=Sordaria brevicollis TaxID=83679 RepID=A0AAE0UEX1_SORBR|nr:hypothetical protein B0T20DRAFT_348045 [Sordaria brevicollis]